jgi:hypothetical protein
VHAVASTWRPPALLVECRLMSTPSEDADGSEPTQSSPFADWYREADSGAPSPAPPPSPPSRPPSSARPPAPPSPVRPPQPPSPGTPPGPTPLQRLWRAFRARPVGQQTIAWFAVVVLLAIVAGAGNNSDSPAAAQSTSDPHRVLDSTSLYNSVAAVFLPRYNQADGSGGNQLSNTSTFCDGPKAGVSDCELHVKLVFGITEQWGYAVTLNPGTGCWTATTYQPYGAHQDEIVSYQHRDLLAPSTADVKGYIAEATQLRTLSGCIAQQTSALTGSGDGAEFIAGMAAQDVQRQFPGPQTATTCSAKGKEVVALAPDSWNFDCTTSLASGRQYIDQISCFDQPPYTNYDSCTHEDGYPQIPLRPLP